VEGLYLREMTLCDKNAIIDYLKEFTMQASVVNGLSGESSCETFEELYEKHQKNKEIVFQGYGQDGRTPSTTYLLVRKEDERIIGSFNIRHYLTRKLDDNFSGHIGYGIRPSERKKGYATKGLQLALDKCREMGMKSVRLGCYTYNTGSRKTIVKNGGKLIGHKEVLKPEDYFEIEL